MATLHYSVFKLKTIASVTQLQLDIQQGICCVWSAPTHLFVRLLGSPPEIRWLDLRDEPDLGSLPVNDDPLNDR